ncbi:hypothetical protein EDC01DRAFT_626552 [Geopyxis carbonaria]|nr:hypothetical protein EDC01DRAFT_626552 [Geopyxis carbonaria]
MFFTAISRAASTSITDAVYTAQSVYTCDSDCQVPQPQHNSPSPIQWSPIQTSPICRAQIPPKRQQTPSSAFLASPYTPAYFETHVTDHANDPFFERSSDFQFSKFTMVNPKTPKRTLVRIEFQRSSTPRSPLAPTPSVPASVVPNFADDDQFPELGSPPPPTVGNVEIPGGVEFPELPTPTTPASPTAAPTPTPTTPTATRVLRPRKTKVAFAFASPAAPKSARTENPAFKKGWQPPAPPTPVSTRVLRPRTPRAVPARARMGFDKAVPARKRKEGGDKEMEEEVFHGPVVTRRVKSPKKPSPKVEKEVEEVEKEVEKEVEVEKEPEPEPEPEDVEMQDVGNDDHQSAAEEVAAEEVVAPPCADRTSREQSRERVEREKALTEADDPSDPSDSDNSSSSSSSSDAPVEMQSYRVT